MFAALGEITNLRFLLKKDEGRNNLLKVCFDKFK